MRQNMKKITRIALTAITALVITVAGASGAMADEGTTGGAYAAGETAYTAGETADVDINPIAAAEMRRATSPADAARIGVLANSSESSVAVGGNLIPAVPTKKNEDPPPKDEEPPKAPGESPAAPSKSSPGGTKLSPDDSSSSTGTSATPTARTSYVPVAISPVTTVTTPNDGVADDAADGSTDAAADTGADSTDAVTNSADSGLPFANPEIAPPIRFALINLLLTLAGRALFICALATAKRRDKRGRFFLSTQTAKKERQRPDPLPTKQDSERRQK
jgi:hypothetical protein